ncbi:MAG: aspartate racemase [Acidobacteria bacterium]|nr:MAG: aspartate racemase [Acidobacteriota bacterium]
MKTIGSGTIGLIGGIGPESTVDYYRLIVAARPGASVVINSVDMKRVLGPIASGDLDSVAQYLADEVQRLARAGADFAAITAITAHIVFDRVRDASPIPVVSLLDAVRDRVQASGWTKVGLIGTRYTMSGTFVSDVFSQAGIAIVTPDTDEQTYIHDKYFNELVRGIIDPQTRDGIVRVIDRMAARDAIEALIIGGTDFSPMLRAVANPPVPFLDVTKIHVDRLMELSQ